MPATITFLGTGTSVGVPVIGCDCAVCTSGDPCNVRTRCSLHLQTPQQSILIDSGPDLREQALREHLRVVDAVLYTHAHLDHIAGFDELRAFCWSREDPLPLFAGPDTIATLRRMYPWAMENTHRNYIRPDLRVLDGAFTLDDLEITPITVEHAGIETYGFRFDFPFGTSLAYLCDVKSIPATSIPLLADLDVLILDALRPTPHPTHMSLEESLAAVGSLRPRRTILTHLAHEIDYATVADQLPPHVTLARDGLRLAFQDDRTCASVEPSQPSTS